MITAPKHNREYTDREIDCQEAMEPGFQVIVDCMLEAGWKPAGRVEKSCAPYGRLIAADNMAQKESARLEGGSRDSAGH